MMTLVFAFTAYAEGEEIVIDPVPAEEEAETVTEAEIAEEESFEETYGTELPGDAEEPTEEPAEEPVEEPVEEPTEEPVEEPVEEPTEEPVEEPTEEPAEEVVEEAKANIVTVFADIRADHMNESVAEGTSVTLYADVSAFEGMEYTITWQYTPDNGETVYTVAVGDPWYTFIADPVTVTYLWRAVITYEVAAADEAAEVSEAVA